MFVFSIILVMLVCCVRNQGIQDMALKYAMKIRHKKKGIWY